MATKRLNVLVYTGTGSSAESVRHTVYSLRRLLSSNYAVISITGDVLIKEPWAPTCALLVIPGGADLPYCRTLNGEGNRRIRAFVNSGGAYMGLCAGGYYGSRRCEFELGDPEMEVAGDRELEFYPGVCRGTAFPGFKYNTESGTHAAELEVNRKPFASTGGMLPEVFRAYVNGGSVFVDAPKYRNRGVEILASYTEKLSVDSGEGSAAVVYCKVGEGKAVLTGPHPEFAVINLNKHAKGLDPEVYDALSKQDKLRSDFWRALLLKLGLRVSEEEQAVPTLTGIHVSAVNSSAVSKVVSSWQDVAITTDNQTYVKGGTDTFHLQKETSAWSMGALTNAALEILEGAVTSENRVSGTITATELEAQDYGEVIKVITPHESSVPTATVTPYFNHEKYFDHLESYKTADRPGPYHQAMGEMLMYAEVVTSTSTLLEKNLKLSSHLPAGTVFTATTQVAGRGRGSNVWVSPAGSLMFSTIVKHPLAINSRAPVVFIQYLAALAVAEGVQTYDATNGSNPSATRSKSAYKKMPVKLKWPNDIYALDPAKKGADPTDPNSYTKIGGILVNSSYSGGDYTLVVGIGLNTSNVAPTTSLNTVLNAMPGGAPLQPFTLEKLLARILTAFEHLYTEFCQSGFAGRLEQLYYSHWLHSGQVVTLETEGGARARIKGITTDWGFLLAEEVRDDGRTTGKVFALQTDSNSFDFFKGLLKRKV